MDPRGAVRTVIKVPFWGRIKASVGGALALVYIILSVRYKWGGVSSLPAFFFLFFSSRKRQLSNGPASTARPSQTVADDERIEGDGCSLNVAPGAGAPASL